MSRSYDHNITIFSPEGKLFQVEYAFRAINSAGVNAVALKGKNCAVLVSQKKIPSVNEMQQDKLLDVSHITSLHKITDNIGVCMIGQPADNRNVVFRLRHIASEFSLENGYEIPCPHLADKMGDIFQLYTQHAAMRLLASKVVLFSIDDMEGPVVYQVDPAGHVCGYQGLVCGPKEQEGTTILEKIRTKYGIRETTDEVVIDVLHALQVILSQNIRASDIEVAIVTTDKPGFTKLADTDVDAFLDRAAEER